MQAVAVVFAGGVGSRMRDGDDTPKQFRSVGGLPVICHSLVHFEDNDNIDAIQVVCLSGWEDRLRQMARDAGITKLADVIPGGATAQESTIKGLAAAADRYPPDTLAVIHDGVRPIITGALIDELIATALRDGSAVTVRPVAETPILSRDGRRIDQTFDRSRAWVVQAPQVFRLGDVVDAYDRMRQINPQFTDVVDTATLMVRLGHQVSIVEGPDANIKITHAADLDFFRGWLAAHPCADRVPMDARGELN